MIIAVGVIGAAAARSTRSSTWSARASAVRRQLAQLDRPTRRQPARSRARRRSRAIPSTHRGGRRGRRAAHLRGGAARGAAARALPGLPAPGRRGRSAARPDRHRDRHDHHLPEHHRVGLERSAADGQRHRPGDDRDRARPRHRRSRCSSSTRGSRRCRARVVQILDEQSTGLLAESLERKREAGAAVPECLRRCAACWPLDRASATWSTAGGPFVVWIFLCGVVMWTLVIERFWYFSRVLPAQARGDARQPGSARSDHHSWCARQIRRAMISRLNAGDDRQPAAAARAGAAVAAARPDRHRERHARGLRLDGAARLGRRARDGERRLRTR